MSCFASVFKIKLLCRVVLCPVVNKEPYLLANKTCLLGVLEIISVSLGHSAVDCLLDPSDIVHIAACHEKKKRAR